MKNKLEKSIELSVWVVTALLLIKFVPRKRIREAIVIYLFKQSVTFLFGVLVVEKNLISYPSRLFFQKTNKSSFTFEFFVYPALCTLFNLYFPEKRHRVIKLLYYFLHTSIITGLEVIAVKYTNLIKYTKWAWYWSFITLWFTYYLSRLYYRWFFKDHTIRNKFF